MTNRAVCVATALLFFSLSAFSQTTGTPPFSSISGGPDVINLANFNVHYSMPVFGRPGRGIPLSYALSVDSSVWTLVPPVFPSTLKTWVHSPTWGKSFGAIPATGVVFYTTTQLTCPDPNGHYPYNQYTATTYVDANNTSHSFHIQVYDDACTTNKPLTATGTATDGSNATMTFACCVATVTTQDGEVIKPLVMDSAANVSGGPLYTDTDSNGNRVTINARASGNFLLSSIVDTLGTTAVSSTGTPPSPVNYTYTNPSGTSVSVVATYVTKNVQLSFGCSGTSGFGPQSATLLDRITLPDGSFYKFTYEPTTTGSGNVTGRIASVTFPTGGTITYSYMGGDNNRGISCTDGSTLGFNRITPDGTWQYRRTVGSPTTSSTTTVIDPQGKTTVISFSGNYETQRQVFDGASGGTLLSSVVTCYNGNISGCETATGLGAPFSQVTTKRSLNGGPNAQTDVKYTINLATFVSLMTETDEYDFGASNPIRQTLITYDTTLGNNILDKPSTVKVFSGSGVLASETDYTYDEDQGALQPSGASQRVAVTCTSGFTKCRGNPTTVKRYKTSSATINQTFTHYDTGQVYQATDPNGAVTTNTYGACGNSLLTNVSMPLSLSRAFTWNCTGGVSTSGTDENNKATNLGYNDAFWRVTSSTDPLSNATNYSYSTTTASGALTFGASTVESLVTLDSLGRQRLNQRRQAPGSTNWDSVSTSYDSNGRPFRVTMPCSAAAGTACPTTPSTTTGYDALNRPSLVTDGGTGTISYSYSGNDVMVTRGPAPAGEHSKVRQMEYDGLGRLTSVCEISSASGSGSCGQGTAATGFVTRYTYNTLGLLTNVTQNAQGTSQGRTYVYDMLGRLTSETNPESGTTSYVYDSSSPCTASSGDLVKKSDGNGNSICYSYDSLHRLTAKTYSGPNLVNQQGNSYYVYDSATVNGVVMSNAKARLAEAYTAATPTGTKITDLGFSYTARGEQATLLESTPHSGGYYTLSLTYWPSGALSTLAGLGLPTISYNSDGEGRPTTVSASSGQNPVTGTSYNVSGQVTGVTLGSGDVANFGFEPNTGRQNLYNEVINGSTISGSLTWNANGTVKQLIISDAFNAGDSQTCNYLYDDMVRISSANCGSVWSQTFTYDPFGNITKSGSASWMPGYNTATNRYTLGGTNYDTNGNLLTDTFHTYQWNVENRPTTFDTITLIHDALGRIVEKNNGGVYSQYVYDASGQKLATMNGATLFKALVSLPGGIQAVFSPTVSFYRVPDWLGSARIISSSTRTYNTSEAFAPFGEKYALGGSAPFVDTFTGMTNSTVSNEYDFPARSLHPGQGRWISPDPAGLGAVDLSNPQTWNRYAYVGNNPTAAVDPLGLQVRQIECVGCNLNGDLGGCDLTASCITWVLNGMEVSRTVALGYLSYGTGGSSPFGLQYVGAVMGNMPDISLEETQSAVLFDDWDALTDSLGLEPLPTDIQPSLIGLRTVVDVHGGVGYTGGFVQPFRSVSMFSRLNIIDKTRRSNHIPVNQETIEAFCTFAAVQENNGFEPSYSNSIPYGVDVSQQTQHGIRSLNANAVNAVALSVLAAPEIYVAASYQNCKAAFK